MCQFCPSARQTLVTALGGLGAISRLVNVWFVKPGLNGLNSSSPLSIVHIEPTHESLRYFAFSQPYAWCEWRKYPCYFLFPLNWEHKAFSYNEFFVSLSVSVPFSVVFRAVYYLVFCFFSLVFLLLINRSASVLCSSSFRSPSVRSPASSASGEFTGKFTVYSSPRNRFLMELSTLRSIWTTIHW